MIQTLHNATRCNTVLKAFTSVDETALIRISTVLTTRVASARSKSTFLLMGFVLMVSVIWIGLQQGTIKTEVAHKTGSEPASRNLDAEVVRDVLSWTARDGADVEQLEKLLNQVVLAEPNLMAIQVKRLSGAQVMSDPVANTLVVPDLHSRDAVTAVDHQTDSRLVQGPNGPVARLDFHYQGRATATSGHVVASNSMQTVDVWPLLLVLTISVLLCVAQWGRSLAKIRTAEGIPKRVRHSIDMLSEGLLVMDKHERIILTNRAFQKMTGLNTDQLIGKSVSSLSWDCSEVTRKSDFPWIRARDESQSQIEQLMRYQMPDGAYRFFSINSSPVESPDEDLRDVLSTFRDVTDSEQHRAHTEHMLAMLKSSRDEVRLKNRELQILATQDAMTGCLNRRAFFEQLEGLWQDVAENDGELACLMLDCDHFKNVNDQYGHQAGDDVLRLVSGILADEFAEPALVCRYGGEEFCVVIQNHWIGSIVEQANMVRERVGSLKLAGYPRLLISVSVGISDLRCGAHCPQELINQADRALYGAKRSGRNTVVTFSESIDHWDQPLDDLDGYANEQNDDGISFRAVTALVSALAYRDYETAEHSRRVADLCVQLADGLLNARDIYLLEIAALLHDIGKIGIADDILLKPDRLSSEEWASMQQYERIGLEIISCTFNCNELFEIIRTYRADYRSESDESRLPVGNDIPLPARLLKLTDAYDAMISDQRHRPGRSKSEVIEELQICAGVQFDPVLVEHLVHSLREEQEQLDVSMTLPPDHSVNEIGAQAEKIADAVDARDIPGIQELAASLAETARQQKSEEIATAAERIKMEAQQGQLEWIALLRNAESLLNLCHATKIENLSHSRKVSVTEQAPS